MDNEPPLWWDICIWVVVVPIILILERMKKMLEAPTKAYRKSQEKLVKNMQLAFKCSGYLAEFVVVECCGVTSRYVRFTPISKSETDHIKALMNDFQGVYIAQKDKAKSKPYDPASWKPLEGRWEEKNRFGVGKVTHGWLFNRTESADAFRSQYECNFHTIPCAFTPKRKLSYHLEGNLVLADDATSIATEIFRINGNDNSVAYYRVGCYQIWKIEGSTCMQFNFEGNFVSENDMVSTSFWSSQDPMKVYSKVHRY